MAEAAVEHLFAVTCGLDSAVIVEQQVLGQVRRALSSAEANHTSVAPSAVAAGPVGGQARALRDRHRFRGRLGGVRRVGMAEKKLGSLADRAAVVVGACAMGSLAAKQLVRAGIGRVHAANCTRCGAAE